MKQIDHKYPFFLLLLLLFLQYSCDQRKINSDTSYVGGNLEMQRFIQNNIQYPQKAIEQNIQGKVLVKFVVEKDGTVSYAEIKKGVDPLLDKEALRVVRSMPKWEPAYKKGKPVRDFCHLPINFRLD